MQPRTRQTDSAAMWTAYERTKQLIPGGSGTMSKAPNRLLRPNEPARIVRGKGCRVWDEAGREFIDFRNALGPVTLGYANDRINEAVRRQLELGTVYGHPSPIETEVAEHLVRLIPCAQQVRYLKTGGEAMAAAIRLARAYTQRPVIISCGYHGWVNTVNGGLAKGNLPEVSAATRTVGFGDIREFEAVVDEVGANQVAALTLAMPYAAAYPNHPFYRQIRELADRIGAVLIFDEIVAGFRVRIGGAGEFFDVVPDLAVFSKGIAAGFPLSVVCGRADIMQLAATVPVSSTFSGDTVALAAALETIAIYEEENVIDHLWTRGSQLMGGLNALFTEYGFPATVEGLAPCSQIVMSNGAEGAALYDAFIDAAYANGVSFYTVIYPNLAHSEADIQEALDRCTAALNDLRTRGLIDQDGVAQ